MERPAGIFDIRYEQDMAIVRTGPQWAFLIGFLILLAVLPLFTGSYFLGFMILTGIALIAVLGLNILIGYAGQISLGHQAFVAVGAYTTPCLWIPSTGISGQPCLSRALPLLQSACSLAFLPFDSRCSISR